MTKHFFKRLYVYYPPDILSAVPPPLHLSPLLIISLHNLASSTLSHLFVPAPSSILLLLIPLVSHSHLPVLSLHPSIHPSFPLPIFSPLQPLSLSPTFASSHLLFALVSFCPFRARPNLISSTLPLFPTHSSFGVGIQLFILSCAPTPSASPCFIFFHSASSWGCKAVILPLIYLSPGLLHPCGSGDWRVEYFLYLPACLSYVLDYFFISYSHNKLPSSPHYTHSLSPPLVLGAQPPPTPSLTSSE